MTNNYNDNLILISGKSASGKSACLMNLREPTGVMYLNCEAGKKLPFRAKFMKGPNGKTGFTITDPYQVYGAFDAAETNPAIHTIVIDTATYLMDMFESVHVLPSENTMAMWGEYAQFWKKLLQNYVAKSTKNVIILAHTTDKENDDLEMETFVKFKGSLMNHGIESYFSNVVSTKKVLIKDLKPNELLKVTPQEENIGYKHVFQTQLTKATKGERIRAPLGMWEEDELYIDNDAQHLIDRLGEYYSEE